MATPGSVPTPPVLQWVEALKIMRPCGGAGLLLRVMPGGSWRLREYDANGDEEGHEDD